MQTTSSGSFPVMRSIAALCSVAAIPLAVFAYWGMYTVAGRHAYDEMDGIFPFAAGVLSAVLVLAAGILWWFGGRSRTHRVEHDLPSR